jgi:hypothetical protein
MHGDPDQCFTLFLFSGWICYWWTIESREEQTQGGAMCQFCIKEQF